METEFEKIRWKIIAKLIAGGYLCVGNSSQVDSLAAILCVRVEKREKADVKSSFRQQAGDAAERQNVL